MAMLSLEINRFLGNALLDPDFLKRVFSAERAIALQGFKLSPAERSTILASQANTLTELSREIAATLATADMADTDAKVGRLMESLPLQRTPQLDVHAYVKRAVYAVTSQYAPDVHYEEAYKQLAS